MSYRRGNYRSAVRFRGGAPRLSRGVTSSGALVPAPADTEAEAARGRLRIPAVGLIISGSANFLLLALALTLWLTVAWVETLGRPAVLVLIVLAMATVVGMVIMLGGWHMIRLRSYSWALVASILAVLPLSAGFMLGFPMGVWALVVLYRSDVQAAFAAKQKSACGQDKDKQKKPGSADSAKSQTSAAELSGRRASRKGLREERARWRG